MLNYSMDSDGIATVEFAYPGKSQNILNATSMGAYADTMQKALADPAFDHRVNVEGSPGRTGGQPSIKARYAAASRRLSTSAGSLTCISNIQPSP